MRRQDCYKDSHLKMMHIDAPGSTLVEGIDRFFQGDLVSDVVDLLVEQHRIVNACHEKDGEYDHEHELSATKDVSPQSHLTDFNQGDFDISQKRVRCSHEVLVNFGREKTIVKIVTIIDRE